MHLAPRHLTLGQMLVVLVAVLLTGASAALLFFVPRTIERAERRHCLQRAQVVAATLAAALAPALDRGDPAQVGEPLQGLSRAPGVLYAGVRDQDGRLLSAWNEERVPPPRSKLPLSAEAPADLRADRSALRVERTIKTPRGGIRLFQIGLSLPDRREAQRASLRSVAIMAAGVFAAGALLSFAIAVLLVNPLRRMMMDEAMSRLDETNQAVRVIERVSASVASAANRFRT